MRKKKPKATRAGAAHTFPRLEAPPELQRLVERGFVSVHQDRAGMVDYRIEPEALAPANVREMHAETVRYLKRLERPRTLDGPDGPAAPSDL